MKLISQVPGLAVWVYGVLAHVVSGPAGIIVLALLMLGTVGGLLAEWQRRKTLDALL